MHAKFPDHVDMRTGHSRAGCIEITTAMPFMPGFHFRFGRRRGRAGGVAPTLPLLEHVRDLQPAEWLRSSITTFARNVASFLPGHFEAYARLHHPLEIND